MLANLLQGRLWDGAAAGQALGTPGLQPSGCPEALGRWVPAARWGFRPCCPFLPLSDKPGECPKVKPRQTLDQCLDDSVCRREEKCCDTGCGWECLAVPRGKSQDKAGSLCVEECEADSQCPQGQRCTSTGCGRVCMDVPGGESQVGACPIPREAGTCLDLCSFDEECPWGHKCCSNGCGHVCTDSPRGREGACPIPRGRGMCLDLCSLDEECPWGHKCCSNAGRAQLQPWLPVPLPPQPQGSLKASPPF
uniref:WAP domain-containing protein n=1 Tax=Accipiter nisus TaxID=211598 RepID=A0A8B9RV26_9AVES